MNMIQRYSMVAAQCCGSGTAKSRIILILIITYQEKSAKLYSNHRQFFTFFRYKKYGADLVCGMLGQLKNMFEKILSQEPMR
jgi:hypothetical protein